MKEEYTRAGIALINSEEECLIVKQLTGKYGLPKGRLEHNETTIQCALRELKEEVGLKITYSRHGNYSEFRTADCILYLCRAVNQISNIKIDKNEIQYHCWVPLRKLELFNPKMQNKPLRDLVKNLDNLNFTPVFCNPAELQNSTELRNIIIPKYIYIDFLANTLREKNRKALTEVVRNVPNSIIRKALIKTLEVERTGGMLTFKKDRRKTPGGVFFYFIISLLPNSPNPSNYSFG